MGGSMVIASPLSTGMPEAGHEGPARSAPMTRARVAAKPEKPRQRPAPPPPRRQPGAGQEPPRRRARARPAGGKPKGLWLYGRHAVEAALANPSRSCHRLLATAEGLAALGAAARRPGLEVADRRARGDRAPPRRRRGPPGPGALGRTLAQARAAGAPARPSPAATSCCCSTRSPIRTMSARSCARPPPSRCGPWCCRSGGSAELGGALAKAASGALDLVPLVEVANLARALEELAALGYWRIALDGHGRGHPRRGAGRSQPGPGARRRGHRPAPPGRRDVRLRRAPADRARGREPQRLGRLRHRPLRAGKAPRRGLS